MAEVGGQNGLRSNQASLNHSHAEMLPPLGTVWLLQFCFSNSSFFILPLGWTPGVYFHAVFIDSLPICSPVPLSPLPVLTHLSPHKRTAGKLDLLPVSERSDHQSRTVSQVFVEVLEVCITNINRAVLLRLLPLVPELRQPGESVGAGNL